MILFLSKFKRIITVGVVAAAAAFMAYYATHNTVSVSTTSAVDSTAPVDGNIILVGNQPVEPVQPVIEPYVPKFLNLSAADITPDSMPAALINDMYNTREQNLSSLSLRLMVAGQWGNRAQYDVVKQEMLGLLKIEDKAYGEATTQISARIDALEAWILGRMIVSALYMGDNTTADNFAHIAAAYLEKDSVKNKPTAFSVWANGYLLEYYAKKAPEKYTQYASAAFNNANKVIADIKVALNKQDAKSDDLISTIVWIDIMNLYAAAVGKDKANYDAIKAALMTDTNTNSIIAALEEVIKTDFPTWAYFWTMRAANASGDEALYDELNDYAKANDILPKVKAELDEVSAESASDPKNAILKILPEPLRNDYVLGLTNQLFAEDID